VQSIVVDEVDQVFDLGSVREVEFVLKSALRDRQVLFFSATITEAIRATAQRWMKEPALLHIHPEQKLAETLEHLYFVCDERDKIDTLRRLVRLYEPKAAIVFVNETVDVAEVVEKLRYAGLSVEALYGEADKQERARAMSGFRAGRFQLLLATDVAARGLDLLEVSHVINLDMPMDADHYVHRAGRTGRMGRVGTVLSIVAPQQQFIINKYARTLSISFMPKAMYEGRVIDAVQGSPIITPKVTPQVTLRGIQSSPQTQSASQAPSQASSQASDKSIARLKKDRDRDRKNKGAPKWLKEKMKQDD